MSGTDPRGRAPPQLLIPPFGTLGPTTPKPDKSHLVFFPSTKCQISSILEGARLRIGADAVRLEVAAAVRVPDSEVVLDRLRLLASALGVKRTEVVEVA